MKTTNVLEQAYVDHLDFFRQDMKRDKLKNLVTTRALEKKAKGSQAYKERFDQMLLLR